MTLKDAKEVRDFVRGYCGLWCIVPLGYKPDRYFARIGGSGGYTDFHSMQEARDWLAQYMWRKRRIRKDWEEYRARKYYPKPRSPIEQMIDQACGLT